jgi:putative phosphoesterase
MRIGLISDTHGLLRPQALAALRGCAHIVHAGDIGDPGILRALSQLAPLTAVRGNNDQGAWADALPDSVRLPVGGAVLHVLHDLHQLTIDPATEGVGVVVSGHSHRPSRAMRAGVLYVNPGSAGPRRFKLPVSVAELEIGAATITARLLELPLPSA